MFLKERKMTEKTSPMRRHLDLRGRVVEVPATWPITDMSDGTVLITMPSGWAIRAVRR
jgi:hypothetical protein